MKASIIAIEYYLPERVVTTGDLAAEFPEWSVAKIDAKTGISERHISAEGECSSDLAVSAAQGLFASGVCTPADIDYILLCTQTPDYFMPSSACLVQDRLNVPCSAGALDINMGCSGYVYGLGLAKGLIETGQARNVLLLTAETFSRLMHVRDKSVRTLLGDAATATLVAGIEGTAPCLGPFVMGTDGSGANSIIVPAGGMRCPHSPETARTYSDESGNMRSPDNIHMDGADVFDFVVRVVPRAVNQLLARAGLGLLDLDLFVFHQANLSILEHLRKRLKIPEDRFYIAMRHCGNTGSSSIPIALKHASNEGKLGHGSTVMLVGFGAGLSWAATLVRWYHTPSKRDCDH